MLWISSVSVSCSENRVTQFSIWLLLRAQCYGTDIFERYLFHSFIFYVYLFCNDLISYHCLSQILYSLNIIPLAITHCLQACSYLKAFTLIAALPGTSFPQILPWLAPLETLGLTQRPYLKLQSLLNTSQTSSSIFFIEFI